MYRIDPLRPAAAYRTFQVRQPLASHFRAATCAEVDCRAYAHGWRTQIDVSTELGARQANYIRMHSGRSFTATEAGTLVTFTFPAGQQCFARHHTSLERPAVFVVHGGDWRGDPRRETPVLRTPDDWLDQFANHQQQLADRIQEG
jgi:hypothetical protein